jgi:hypothetical protein
MFDPTLLKSKKKTYGELSLELKQDGIDLLDTYNEIVQKAAPDIENELMKAVETGKKLFLNADFYVLGLTVKEPLLGNIKIKWLARFSCPTPTLDQNVFKYHRFNDQLEHLWTLPCPEAYHEYLMNYKNILPEEGELLSFCVKFSDGILDNICREMNGEKKGESQPIILFDDIPKDPSSHTLQ